MSHSKVEVTRLPPGPEDESLRFQRYQFDPLLGTTANRQFLSPQSVNFITKDPTVAAEIGRIADRARAELLEAGDESDAPESEGT